jgi:NitT/TauT family transport system ATP-binding protein
VETVIKQPENHTTSGVISATAVNHSYHGVSVLSEVSLQVRRGEIIAVIGPSGCGKTTLVRVLAGLLVPDHGKVERHEATVGVVFQDPNLLPWRRVTANARLFVGPSDETAYQHVEHLLGMVGLLEHRTKWPYELSGGMRMRLSLVRALACRPTLLLLDEAFGSLDQITRHQLHDDFLHLQRENTFGALVVTHAIDEAVYLADRIVVMSPQPGRVIADLTVPFGRTRVAGLRYEPEFTRFCGDVASHLAGVPRR